MPGYVVPCDGVLLLVEYRHATLYERANRNVPWASTIICLRIGLDLEVGEEFTISFNNENPEF